MTTASPPGWHPDPNGSGALRWWDGTSWTEHVHATSWFDEATIANLAAHVVAGVRRKSWGETTGDWSLHQVLEYPDSHRAAVRGALDGLRRVLQPGEDVVLLQTTTAWGRGEIAVTSTVVALTTRRAVASVAAVGFGSGDVVDAEYEHAPLAAIEIDRKRVIGTPGVRLVRKRRGGFELSSRSADVIARLQAFVAAPDPTPFPELAALLALPRLDPSAPPPDWYPDPATGGADGVHRWWDGFRWTEATSTRGEYVEPQGGGDFGDVDYGGGDWD